MKKKKKKFDMVVSEQAIVGEDPRMSPKASSIVEAEKIVEYLIIFIENKLFAFIDRTVLKTAKAIDLAVSLIMDEDNPDEKEVETVFEMVTNFQHAVSWLLGESNSTEVIEATVNSLTEIGEAASSLREIIAEINSKQLRTVPIF